MDARPVLGAVEGGGTKFVCMIGTSPTDVVDEVTIPTTDPEETIGAVVEFFARPRPGIRLQAIGVATFGPIGLDPTSADYGCVLSTPKQRWSGARILAPLRRRFGVPLGWDTDVNGAILGEARWGAARGLDAAVYLTVGTGIGGGALVQGSPVHGLLHPEMGHLPVTRVPGDDFPGICPFHGACLEGMASGPALAERRGRPTTELAPEDPVWDLAAAYLAQGLAGIVYTLSPHRIVLGGGVMRQPGLLPLVRQALLETVSGYLPIPTFAREIDSFVVASLLDQKAGLYGALASFTRPSPALATAQSEALYAQPCFVSPPGAPGDSASRWWRDRLRSVVDAAAASVCPRVRRANVGERGRCRPDPIGRGARCRQRNRHHLGDNTRRTGRAVASRAVALRPDRRRLGHPRLRARRPILALRRSRHDRA